MTPDQQQQFDSLIRQVQDLTAQIQALSNTTLITPEVEGAFRERLGIPELQRLSSRTAASQTNTFTVSSVTYHDLKAPVGFITVKLNNNLYDIPYY